jgi:obg-like ATPase 1
MEIFDFLG